MKRTFKKIIATTLIGTILVTTVGTVFASIQNGQLTLPFTEPSKEVLHSQQVPQPVVTPPPVQYFNFNENSEKLIESTRTSIVDGENPFKNDKFNFSKEDVLSLMKQGFTLKEIAEADNVGNEINYEPTKLLEMKKSKKIEIAEIKKQIIQDRRTKHLKKLKEKYSNEANLLEKEKISNENDQLNVLSFVDSNDISSTSQFIKDYKKSGKSTLSKYYKQKKKKISNTNKTKYMLSEAESADISDEELDKLVEISTKSKKDLKKLLQEFKQENPKLRRAK